MECMSICSLSSSSSDRSRDWLSSFCVFRQRGRVKPDQRSLKKTAGAAARFGAQVYLALGEVEDGQVQAASVRRLPVHGQHVAVIIRQSVPHSGSKQRTICELSSIFLSDHPRTPSQSRAISMATTLTCLYHYNLQTQKLVVRPVCGCSLIAVTSRGGGGIKTDGSEQLHQHTHLILDWL